MEDKLVKIKVQGVVQGVGFRPFIYRLACEHNLTGWVRNTSGCVDIEVEGETERIDGFLKKLKTKAPSIARVERLETSHHLPKGYTEFEIKRSMSKEGKYQLVSPDIATCPDCQREIFSPDTCRFGYAFTNCTNCGPRFTIIKDIPYDRLKTTMNQFRMCPECQQEYENPSNRRFHAQPNACPKCGPALELIGSEGKPSEGIDPIKATAALLKAGKIIAAKGLGGFHLACDATNHEAVSLLRARKKRPSKPFAVMMATLEDIERHCLVSHEEKTLLQSTECPIVLLKWRDNSSNIVQVIAPNLKYLGVMLPYTPLHHLLLDEAGIPLAMTSGNLSEEPISKDNDEALGKLRSIADCFLLHNRDIYTRNDDSVYMVEVGKPQVLRRARGYAPNPVILPFKSQQVLACGGELKNTFCLARDEHSFLSQHIGDMENQETLELFENTVELYKKLFRIKPKIIAYDMHPEYLSTKYALTVGSKPGLSLVPVQHHHAHIVSCMVENNVEATVIGVAFDGTGYGIDGTIWGGEFLLADWHSFQRLGHLEYVPLPGGTAAIKKPYRMALSYLYTLLGENYSLEGLPFGSISTKELELIKQQLKRGVNCPLTSSAGRCFDAVASLVGLRDEVDYEAQAAIELEMLAYDTLDDFIEESYPFSIVTYGERTIVKLGEMFSSIVGDVRKQTAVSKISLRFHHTMTRIIVRMCEMIKKKTRIDQVALSGGVFQNRLLLRLTTAALQREGFNVLTHHQVPCNDGGISLGQVVISNFASI